MNCLYASIFCSSESSLSSCLMSCRSVTLLSCKRSWMSLSRRASAVLVCDQTDVERLTVITTAATEETNRRIIASPFVLYPVSMLVTPAGRFADLLSQQYHPSVQSNTPRLLRSIADQ